MTMRVVALGLLAVFAAGSGAEEKKAPPPVYKTPQAAFDAWVAAVKKHDFKAMADCMSAEMHKDAAAQLAAGALALRAAADAADDEEGKKFRQKHKPLFDALDKHGLGPEATKKIKVKFDDTEAARAKNAAEVAPLIKEPKALMLALQAAYRKAGLLKIAAPADLELKLKDVKVTGDRAAGVMIGKTDGKESKAPLHFVKVSGGWLLTTPPKPAEKPEP